MTTNETRPVKYTLITVTYDGQVSHSRGYESLYMCEQAKSLALTGMTVEQNKEADEAYARREREARERWDLAHPPRQPTKAERSYTPGTCWSGTGGGLRVNDDGTVSDLPPSGGMSMCYSSKDGESVHWVRGGYIHKHRHDVKHAECIIEP